LSCIQKFYELYAKPSPLRPQLPQALEKAKTNGFGYFRLQLFSLSPKFSCKTKSTFLAFTSILFRRSGIAALRTFAAIIFAHFCAFLRLKVLKLNYLPFQRAAFR
jgi:hypothetical protein